MIIALAAWHTGTFPKNWQIWGSIFLEICNRSLSLHMLIHQLRFFFYIKNLVLRDISKEVDLFQLVRSCYWQRHFGAWCYFFFHYFSDVFYTWSMYLLVNTYSKLSVWSSRNICVKMNKINSPFLLTIKFFMYLFWIIIVSCTTIRWFLPSYVMSKKLLVYIKLLQLWFVKRSECRLNNWKVHYDQHGSFLLCASQLPINVDTSLSFWKHPV